jgi:hypothetical protein
LALWPAGRLYGDDAELDVVVAISQQNFGRLQRTALKLFLTATI